jgi:factor associated with neutral sphingomyelinase activation
VQTQSLESEHFELSLNINFVDISEFFNSLRDAYFLFK